MDKHGSNYMRELIRVLVRNLGVLEKYDAGCCGVSIAQCHAIVEIGRNNEISLNELAELLTLDKSTMSRTINNLVESGLVIRELHPEDRRYITIKLTEQGNKVYKNIEGSMTDYYGKIFSSIPEDRREQVLESLKMLIDAVNDNKCC
ncbi:MAG: MarR family winged helix-turn-helix transcriptional regulator [Solirubrobacterales bacterium]